MTFGLAVVDDDEGLHDYAGAARAAAQLGQDLPALESGDGALADGTEGGLRAVHGGFPPDGQPWRSRMA